MKKTRILSLFLLLSLLFFVTAMPVCATEGETQRQTLSDIVGSSDEMTVGDFTVHAKAAILLDLNTGRTVYEKNIDDQIFPASLTKIMTCLLALENGNLSEIVTVNESAFVDISSDSSTAGLQIGEQMTLENMLYCLMISSGNEAANVVAEHIAGSVSDFVRMMNERAYELGCTNTHFVNPHGLHDEQHFTTVSDLVLITQAALKSENFRTITDTVDYELPATNLSPARFLQTTNQLLDDSTSNPFYYSRATGIKTGYTTPAGRCVISCANGDGMSFLAVICGAETSYFESGTIKMESFEECIRLFKYGFEQFQYVTAVSPLYPVAQITVNNSAASEVVSLAPTKEIRLLLPRDYDPALLVVDAAPIQQSVEAPVYSGDILGTAEVRYDGELLGKTQLQAINDVARSELSAAAGNTSSYIQQNWWKWIVIVIVLAIVAVIVALALSELRRRKARREHMANRRKALQQRFYDYRDDV